MNPALQNMMKGIYKFLTNANERKFIWMSLRYGSKKRYQERKINFAGYKFIVPDSLSFIWQFKEIFVEEFYRFESKNDIPVIYDCGANVGTSCAFFKYYYPQSRIIAFEPSPKIAEYLKKNIRNNSLSNIEIITKAVWINDDGIELGLEDADGSSIHLNKNKTKVESVRLKDFLEKESKIDMLKIDIEGAEIEVLNDCRNNLFNVRNIFVEFHSYLDQSQKLADLIGILEDAGFRYFIKQSEDRYRPFLNRINKFNPSMDLQLNIFAYRPN